MPQVNIGRIELIVELDIEDIEKVKKYTWGLSGSLGVIQASVGGKTVPLAKFLLNYVGPLQVDHKDRNKRNYKKENLRLATPQQNAVNKPSPIGNKYKGVRRYNKTYQANIKVNGKSIYLGTYKDEVSAAKAYDVKSKELFGEFAYLNIR